MFTEFVEGTTFNLKDLEEKIFEELMYSGDISGYQTYGDPDEDYDSAWELFVEQRMFDAFLSDLFDEMEYNEYSGQNGKFIWIKALDVLVVSERDDLKLSSTPVATCTESSLDKLTYAEGIVKNKTFYATTIAKELN